MAYKRQFELRIGIVVAFAMIMIPSTLGMVGYLYWSNTKLIVASTVDIMQRSTTVISRDVQSLISPVARAVQSTAELVRSDIGSLQTIQGLGYFYRQVKALPQMYSMYVGFGDTGNFYQIIHIPPSLKSLGPSSSLLPENTQYALRILDESSGSRADSFIIYGEWGDVKQVDRGQAIYDPRKRPWYKDAWGKSGISVSNAYVFASSGLIGLTVSHRVATSTGVEIGTVGADITLDTLSTFMKNAQIGKFGKVFIINSEGQLVSHPDPKMGVQVVDGTVRLLKASNVADPIVADAVKAWKTTGKDHFEMPLGDTGSDYMVSFTAIPLETGLNWTVGVLVEKDELIGPLKQSSIYILLAGGLVILFASIAINLLAKLLTGPIDRIIAETHKIEAFDLSGKLSTTSPIAEAHQLINAVETMKRSLRSFSVYVPKELVRAIVSDDGDTSIGIRRQDLTVMFSDIKGFTDISENLAPEQVVASLSEYFKRMSEPIHQTQGVIDKYIGDAIMAIWNAPIPDSDHINHACEALLICRQVDEQLAREFREVGQDPFHSRFGLHTGEAVVGNVGSSDRMQYSAIGAMVNLAARLESLNKVYGTQLLVSEQVVEAAQNKYVFRRVDKVVPVGTSRPIDIYELIGSRDVASSVAASAEDVSKARLWEECLTLYDCRDWKSAAVAFADYKAAYSSDIASDLMIARCEQFEVTPPSKDWDGAQWLNKK